MQNMAIIFGLLIGIALIVFAYSLYISFSIRAKNKPQPKTTKPANQTSTSSSVFCPLCNSALAKGENLSSKVFGPIKDGTDSNQRCTILGCPHCLPYCQNGVKRICPVCKKKVPADGYLIYTVPLILYFMILTYIGLISIIIATSNMTGRQT